MGHGKVHPNAANNAPHAPPAYYSVKDQAAGPLPYPAVYSVPRKPRSPCCCCFAWLCSLLVFLIVALGIAALIFWLVVRPKLPDYEVTNVRLSGLETSLLSGTVNTNVSFTLDTYNPNKRMGFYYDDIDVRVEALGVVVGQGELPSFYQGHKNRTIIDGNLQSPQIALPTDKRDALLQASTDARLPLNVAVDVKTRIKVGSVKTSKIKVKVRCVVVTNPTLPDNQVISRKCSVKRR